MTGSSDTEVASSVPAPLASLPRGGSWTRGAELDRVSARNFGRYADSGINWRVVEGYGTVIASHGHNLPVMLASPVQSIDHSGRRPRGKGCGARKFSSASEPVSLQSLH